MLLYLATLTLSIRSAERYNHATHVPYLERRMQPNISSAINPSPNCGGLGSQCRAAAAAQAGVGGAVIWRGVIDTHL